MHFKIESASFAKAFTDVTDNLLRFKSDVFKHSGLVTIKCEDGELILYGEQPNVSVKCKLDCEEISKGIATVEGRKLKAILNRGKQSSMEVIERDKFIVFNIPDYNLSYRIMKYPVMSIPERKEVEPIDCDLSRLLSALKMSLHAINNKGGNYTEGALIFEREIPNAYNGALENHIVINAMDGHRAVNVSFQFHKLGIKDPGILLSKISLEQLIDIKVFKSIAIGDRFVKFSNDMFDVYIQQLAYEILPDFWNISIKPNIRTMGKIVIPRKRFIECIDSVIALTKGEEDKDIAIKLTFGNNQCEVLYYDGSDSFAKCTFECDTKDLKDIQSFHVSYLYLLQLLKQINHDSIVLECPDKGNGAIYIYPLEQGIIHIESVLMKIVKPNVGV